VFGHGVVGAAWFLGFVGRRFYAGLRDPSRDATALCSVAVFYLTVMFAYDLLTLPTFTLMIALGLLWRRESDPTLMRSAFRRAAPDERSQPVNVPTQSGQR